MKKIGLTLLSIVLVLAVFAGCSKKAPAEQSSPSASTADSSPAQQSALPSAESTETKSDEKVTVEFWATTGVVGDTIPKVIEDYKKVKPNVEIKLTTHGTDPHKEALKVAAASGTLPDMWFNWSGSFGQYYAENGYTLNLNDHVKENNWESKYIKSAMDLFTYNGELSGVPFHIRATGVFYRKDLFEKNNVQIPKTFAEFESALQKLKDGGATPITTAGKAGWMNMRLLEVLIEHFAGSELRDKFYSLEASWNDPAVIKAYQKWKEWADKGYFPKGFLTLEPVESRIPLYKGTAAMILEPASFDAVAIKDQQKVEDYGYFTPPTDQTPLRLSSYGDMMQINKKSPKAVQEAALGFAEYITSLEVINKFGVDLSPPMATLGVQVSPETPHVNDILAALEQGSYLVTDQALPQELVQKFFQAQDSIITGSMTPESAAKFMQDEVEKYKAQNKK